MTQYFQKYPSYKQVRSPWVTPIPNQQVFNVANYLSTDLPLQILEKVSSLPYYGSEKKRS